MTMPTRTRDLTAPPRAVLRLLNRMIEERLGSAKANAWAAVCADRERAKDRAEVQRMLAEARRG